MELSPLSNVLPTWGAPTLEDIDVSNVKEGERLRGSRRQLVRFYKKKFREPIATAASTNPKTGEVKVTKTEVKEFEREMVLVVTPGDKNIVEDFAQDYHRREFWAHYKAFRDGRQAPLGTSLDECSFISPDIATELKYRGCQTVEQLADSSDILCSQIPNGWELREFARAKVETDKKSGEDSKVTALKMDLEAAQRTIKELKDAQERMQAMILDSKGMPVESKKAK